MSNIQVVEARVLDKNGNMTTYVEPKPTRPKQGEKQGERVLCEADIKEVMLDTCYEEVCTPLGCADVPYPCVKEKVCTFQLKIVYTYPLDVEDEVNKCIQEAAIIGAAAAISLMVLGQFVAALKAGSEAFINAFNSCIAGEIRDKVKLEFKIDRKPHEQGGRKCEWEKV